MEEKEEKKILSKFIFVASIPFFFLAFGYLNIAELHLENFLFANLYQVFENKITINPKSPIEELGLILNSGSSLSLLLKDSGEVKVLYKKFEDKRVPIASLTKLMTAVVSIENYPLSLKIRISREAAAQEGTGKLKETKLKEGDIYSVSDLLNIMIVESNNNAAYALAESMGMDNFLNEMNSKAESLGLKNTGFYNPTGLDPKEESGNLNYSSAKDLIRLSQYILKNHKEIFDISVRSTPTNTNELLSEIPNIIGGKTGYTDLAGGSLVLLTKENGGYIASVILQTDSMENRFEEMKKLIAAISKLNE